VEGNNLTGGGFSLRGVVSRQVRNMAERMKKGELGKYQSKSRIKQEYDKTTKKRRELG